MSRCGKFDVCDSCINEDLDPFQCEDCDEGSNYEGEDTTEELTITEFKDLLMREAA